MILGILSDTHGKLEPTMAGVRKLLQAGAKHLVHCGDVCGGHILDELTAVPCSVVPGNNDWPEELKTHCTSRGIEFFDPFGELELAGRRVAFTHGDDYRLVRRLLDEARHDFLLVGHSHQRADQPHGRIRLINPGALHRANPRSVATLDLASGVVTFLDVP
jgi:putative phosphoesterase